MITVFTYLMCNGNNLTAQALYNFIMLAYNQSKSGDLLCVITEPDDNDGDDTVIVNILVNGLWKQYLSTEWEIEETFFVDNMYILKSGTIDWVTTEEKTKIMKM